MEKIRSYHKRTVQEKAQKGSSESQESRQSAKEF